MPKKDRRERNRKKRAALFSGLTEKVRQNFSAKSRRGDFVQLEFTFSGEQIIVDKKDPVGSLTKQLDLLSQVTGSNPKSQS